MNDDRFDVYEERLHSVENVILAFEERERELLSRIISQGSIIEFLLAHLCSEKGPTFRNAIASLLRQLSTMPNTILSDHAAVWWSDVAVRVPDHMNAALARSEKMTEMILAKTQDLQKTKKDES